MSDFDDWLAEQAQQREEAGLTRRLVPRHPSEKVIDLAGNDYLGLARTPPRGRGAVAAAQEYGAGAGASRLVTGTLTLHEELEHALVAFTGFPAALVFSTGYRQPLRGLGAGRRRHARRLGRPRARLDDRRVPAQSSAGAGGPPQRRGRGRRCPAGRRQPRALVLVETIYSVLGDAAPIRELAEVCAARGAVLVADEAHALGVAGVDGRGLLHAAGLADRSDVVATLTLSKSLGAQGGACSLARCSRAPRQPRASVHLRHRARARRGRWSPGRAARRRGRAAAGGARERGLRRARPGVRGRAAGGCGARGADAGSARGAGRRREGGRERRTHRLLPAASTPDGISRLRLTAHAQLDDDELARAVGVLDGLL